MNYKSINELERFSFQDAVVASIEYTGNTLKMDIDNLTILSSHRLNRDIQDARANEVALSFSDASICRIYQEGYKVYDADHNLKETHEDRTIDVQDYPTLFKDLNSSVIYQIQLTSDTSCSIFIDAEYYTYVFEITYKDSFVEWSRFLKKE